MESNNQPARTVYPRALWDVVGALWRASELAGELGLFGDEQDLSEMATHLLAMRSDAVTGQNRGAHRRAST